MLWPHWLRVPTRGQCILYKQEEIARSCVPKLDNALLGEFAPLLREAKKRGAKVIHGIEMLLHQGTAQFEIYTGHKAPEEIMRKVLLENK